MFAGSRDVSFRRGPLSPLLEVEGHCGGLALIAQGACPLGIHRASLMAALSARNYPVNPPFSFWPREPLMINRRDLAAVRMRQTELPRDASIGSGYGGPPIADFLR